MNQQKHPKKIESSNFDKKSCQYYDSCNSNYHLIDKKYKNSNNNNNNNNNNENNNNNSDY